MNQERPKVTVYVPCHHYGRFLGQAVQSVIDQLFQAWELIIVDDGSTDETARVALEYVKNHPDRIRVIRLPVARGLPAAANAALADARGDYVMRLDADDFLDESALLILAGYLDAHPDVGLVYPNYTYVDEYGTYLGVEYRKKIGRDAKLLDLPAHGACTMVRKRILKSVGGYDETYDAQDGHELWLKVLHRYQVSNVATPLFFYRQHGVSVSRDESRLLSARRRIKQGLAAPRSGGAALEPGLHRDGLPRDMPNFVLEPFAGRPLIDYTLDAARTAGVFDRLLVTTDDPKVLDYCSRFDDVLAVMRPLDLSLPHVRITEVLYDAVQRLEREHGEYFDAMVLLSVHCPLRRPEHIQEAIDTLVLYNVDNVISVYEDDDLHLTHGEYGLTPLNTGMLQRVRLEREALYVDNGAINVFWREVVTNVGFYGKTIGHVLMPRSESAQIKDEFSAWQIEQILRRRQETT